MRNYGMVSTRYWTDSKILHLSQQAKLVGLYLLTGQETNLIGCFRCTPMHVAANKVCDLDDAETAFRELIDVGYIEYDKHAGVIYLPNWFRYNQISNLSSGKAALKAVLIIPDSHLVHRVVEGLRQFADHMPDGWEHKCQHVCPDLSGDMCAPSHTQQDAHPDSHHEMEICSVPHSAPEQNDGTPVIELPLVGKLKYVVSTVDVAHMHELYPAVEVIQELRKMVGWLESNPCKRKTKRGIKRFINSWLARAQDAGGATGRPSVYSHPRDVTQSNVSAVGQFIERQGESS